MEKRQRGRPRKPPTENDGKIETKEKRGRGRPAKLSEPEGKLSIPGTGEFIAKEYIYGLEEGLTIQTFQSGKFNTLNDLLNLPWIKPHNQGKNAKKFTISKKSEYNYLMIENEYGTQWWILAILPKEFNCNLPEFRIKYNYLS